MSLNKKEQQRYAVIIEELSNLSRDGWSRATHADYAPLEKELALLGEKKGDRPRTAKKLSPWELCALEEAVRSYWTGSQVAGAAELIEKISAAREVCVR